MNACSRIIAACALATCMAYGIVIGDFEAGTLQNWAADPYQSRNANGTLTNTTERAHGGACSLKTVVTSTNDSWDFAPYVDIPYESGTSVTSSFWSCFLGNGLGVKLWGEWRSNDHSLIASAGGTSTYTATDAWRKVTYIASGTLDAGACFYRIQARIYANPGDTVYIDDAELGNAAPGPEPYIRVAPSGAFGPLATNTATNIVFTITNDGAWSNLMVATPLSLSGTVFAIVAQPDTNVLAPGSSTVFTVRFMPASIKSYSAKLSITNTSETSVCTVSLSGVGMSPVVYSPTVLAAWDFEDQDMVADGGAASNAGRMLGREAVFGGTYSYDTGASSASALSTSGWHGGMTNKWWQIEVDASGRAGLVVSSKQKSSNTGPRDFAVQCRVGVGGEWEDVPGGSVSCTNDGGILWHGTAANLALPSSCDNQTSVFVRWCVAGTNAVNGGAILSAGTSRIDDVVVDVVPEPAAAGALVLLLLARYRRPRADLIIVQSLLTSRCHLRYNIVL